MTIKEKEKQVFDNVVDTYVATLSKIDEMQPYLSMGWLIDNSTKQTEDISSLKSAKSTASVYLTQSKLSEIESNIY